MALKPGYLKWKLARQINSTATEAGAAKYTADSAVQQAEALAASGGAVNAPTFGVTYGGLRITLTCSTPSSTIQYQVNGGGYSTYTGYYWLNYGDNTDAYATAAGLTDSGVVSYDTV